MPRINETTDMDPCLISLLESCRDILAEPAPYLIRGTSLKVIERLHQLIKFFYSEVCLFYQFTKQTGSKFFMLRYG